MSDFRTVVAGILFVLWIATSYGLYVAMVDASMASWWQVLIPMCFLWLFYAGIVRVLQSDFPNS